MLFSHALKYNTTNDRKNIELDSLRHIPSKFAKHHNYSEDDTNTPLVPTGKEAEYEPITEGILRVIYAINLLCAVVHASFAATTFAIASGNDMSVQLYRVRGQVNVNSSTFTSELVESDHVLHLDVICGGFFIICTSAHLLWVSYFPLPHLVRMLKRCLCWWTWVEYSLSASLMLVGIGLLVGIREDTTIVALFFLSFTTMFHGLFTELLSEPNKDLESWKLDETQGRVKSYFIRMTPHFLGFVPYLAAFGILISRFEMLMSDVPEENKDNVPAFVRPMIYVSLAVFSCFTFVQMVYQWRAPKHYWQVQIWYPVLSLTAKVFLGTLLLWNVFNAATVDQALNSNSNN